MDEDALTNEELARALLQYVREKEIKKDLLYKKINNIYNNKNILNNYIDINYEKYNYYKNSDGEKWSNDERTRVSSSVSSTLQQAEAITSFIENTSSILDIGSPSFLRRNERVILESIKRNINSIVFAYEITDNVKLVAIEEAKKQGYVFRANTPNFMLHNTDLIKLSIQKDISTIDLVPDDAWTEELATFAYQNALKSGYVISQNSPGFLRSNIEIIKQSLKLDCNSGIHVIWKAIEPENMVAIEKYIVENDLDFVIDFHTPINFRRNINICIKSAKVSPNSINYADWNYLNNNPEGLEKIFDILIEQKYVLSDASPEFLRNNTLICLNSIKNDIYSARFFSKTLTYWLEEDLEQFPVEEENDRIIVGKISEIRHYLMKNGYYSFEQILKFPSSLLKDEKVLDYYLEQMGVSREVTDENGKLYYERVKNFIVSSLTTPLKISDVRKIFQIVAVKKWENYRRENNDYYTNIFNRICDSLEKNNNFIVALNELKFLVKIDDVLDERKYALFNAFIEYHQIYHNTHIDNKLELLQMKRDEISRNAALFISKSKEDFISEKIREFDELFKQFFIIRIDNPIVKKKVVEIKQREMLRELFNKHDADLTEKIESIINKYLAYNFHSSINKDKLPQILELFVSEVINKNVSSVDDILLSSKPIRFDEYEIYEKVLKLINRLNNHNISFDGQEVDKYRNLITFDGGKYVYSGAGFDDNELVQIAGYKDLKYVFGKVKSEIIQIAKSIDNFNNLTQDDIKTVIGECPFTDEYYKFDFNVFNRSFINVFSDYVNSFEDRKIILDDTNYELVCDLVINNGLLQLAMINGLGMGDSQNSSFFGVADTHFTEIKSFVSDKELCDVIESLPNLTELMSKGEFTLENLDRLLDLKNMLKYADSKQISMLGKDVIKKIYSNNGFTSSSQSERISVACDLANAMLSRCESTVPYINGSVGNYMYSMYDSTDETLLTAGLDTNACFRCCGNDNDFLHYCALDKNGFVIKLTDSEGNFIGRASGFRNGNGVYINQLRTVYDKKSSAYISEKASIISAFEKACSDIVEISQNNSNEENKIDFVVVTRSYTLDGTKSNVNTMTTDKIGGSPMENQSDDWKRFVSSTKNLRESKILGKFNTDFGNYSIVCIKSAIGNLTPDEIKKGDVPAVYKRTRKQINIVESSEISEQYINRVRAHYSYQSGESFNYTKIPKNCKTVIGDNWYIVFNEQCILDGCYLPSDKFAEEEFCSFMQQLGMDEQSFESNVSGLKTKI